MDQIMKQPQKIVVVGDAFVSPETMEDALRASAVCCGEIRSLFWGTADKQEFTARQLKVERGGPEAVAYAEGLEEAIADADSAPSAGKRKASQADFDLPRRYGAY